MEYTGRLKSWYGTWGFVYFEAERRDIFVHLSAFLKGFLPEIGSAVAFELGPSNKPDKPDQCRNVRVIRSAAEVLADFQRQRLVQVLATNPGGGAA